MSNTPPTYPLSRYPKDWDDFRPGVDSKGIITVQNNGTPIVADVVNRYRDAILAIEAELGFIPSGRYDTVRARLDALEALISSVAGLGSFLFQERQVPTNNQTSFTLRFDPLNSSVMFFVDGLKMDTADYTISGRTITYNGSVSLINTDVVEFAYLVSTL